MLDARSTHVPRMIRVQIHDVEALGGNAVRDRVRAVENRIARKTGGPVGDGLLVDEPQVVRTRLLSRALVERTAIVCTIASGTVVTVDDVDVVVRDEHIAESGKRDLPSLMADFAASVHHIRDAIR